MTQERYTEKLEAQKPAANVLEKRTQVSMMVPTLRRPEFLFRCLRSLALQTSRPREVLVGIQKDDDLSHPILRLFSDRLAIRPIQAQGVGVVGSMNSCLAEANGNLIGFVDDDVELPPDWLARMIDHLENHPDVLGAGGRDFLQDHPTMRRSEPRTLDVGRLYWFGRISGNHYRGDGSPRKVDLLRGSNCLYRGDFLRNVGFDESLRGQGAQVHWELALALQTRQQGRTLYYDPEIEVIHHVAPRMDADQIHRGQFSYDATVDLAFNETLVILKHGSGLFRVTGLLWQFLVGSPACPGIARIVRTALEAKPFAYSKIRATSEGRFLAWIAMARWLLSKWRPSLPLYAPTLPHLKPLVIRILRRFFPQMLTLIRLYRHQFRNKDSYLNVTGWTKSIAERRPCGPDGSAIPLMNYPAISLFRARLSKEMRLFEYGAGFSTLFFSELVGELVSVEHNLTWYDLISKRLPKNARMMFIQNDVDGSYCRAIHLVDGLFDVVVVDGRDRVNCIKQALGKLNEGGVIVLDDSQRERYQEGIHQTVGLGFKRLDLEGLKPVEAGLVSTTILYRGKNCFNL